MFIFGCTHYLSHFSQNTIMNLLSYLKELNRIEYRTLDDLFDFDDDMPFKEYVFIEIIVS